MSSTEAVQKKQRYYGTKAASERLEVAEVTVRGWCRDKELPAIKMGKKLWKIPVEVVEERLAKMLAGRGGSLLVDARR